jgi:hypothetical protein
VLLGIPGKYDRGGREEPLEAVAGTVFGDGFCRLQLPGAAARLRRRLRLPGAPAALRAPSLAGRSLRSLELTATGN